MSSFGGVHRQFTPRTFAAASNDVLPGVREDPSQGRLELLAMPRRAGDSRRS
jgi:hypothetical protein